MKTLIKLIVVVSAIALVSPAMAAQDDLLLDQIHASKKMKARAASAEAGSTKLQPAANSSSPDVSK
jgi:hypothetical protein